MVILLTCFILGHLERMHTGAVWSTFSETQRLCHLDLPGMMAEGLVHEEAPLTTTVLKMCPEPIGNGRLGFVLVLRHGVGQEPKGKVYVLEGHPAPNLTVRGPGAV